MVPDDNLPSGNPRSPTLPVSMPADDPEHDCLHYLTCDLPLGYPLKVPVAKLLLATQTSLSRRALLNRQAEFLDFASRFLDTHPWITYLAAIKHEAVLVTIPTYDDQLVDIVDKTFYWDLQEKCENLRKASRAVMDEATAQDCDRLVLLQTEAPQIDDAIKNFASAIQAGFNAVEPLPPPPPEPDLNPEKALIKHYGIIAAVCAFVGSIIPPYYGGMIWGVIGLIITATIGYRAITKEKARVSVMSATFKTYMIHENYLVLCRKTAGRVLALPFEIRKTALTNLPPCLEALKALPPERDALEARYVRPFFAKTDTQSLAKVPPADSRK